MQLNFRQAEAGDLPGAQEAYRQLVQHLMATINYPQWSTDYPTADDVAHWVTHGHLHIAATDQNQIIGVMVLNNDFPDGYNSANWSFEATRDEILVMHALGVLPEFTGHGVAKSLISAALELAEALGCKTLRLDAYVDNSPARELYRRCGFTDLGLHTIHYPDTDLNQFYLFEYVL